MYDIYFDTKMQEKEYKKRNGLKQHFSQPEQDTNNGDETEGLLTIESEQYEYIMRDLFLWAILMNRIELAKVFLCFMKYRICPALIATKIFKSYYEEAGYGHLKDSYQNSAAYFEKYAINCLDYCDDEDADRACEIILQQNEIYGYVTCLQVCFQEFVFMDKKLNKLNVV